MGTLLHSCVEVSEPIELSFVVVSGVSPGIGVFDDVNMLQEEVVLWGFSPHWFQWVSVAYLLNRNVFDSCMKS